MLAAVGRAESDEGFAATTSMPCSPSAFPAPLPCLCCDGEPACRLRYGPDRRGPRLRSLRLRAWQAGGVRNGNHTERTDGHERHDGHPYDGNRNGVIRRYLPKRSRIEPSMAADVQAIVDEINNRPMWVLGYRTPAEAFADELLELTDKQGRCTSK